MKYLGLKIGLVVIIIPLTVIGAWFVVSELGGGSAILWALAIIGGCAILDGFADWASDKVLGK